MTLEIKAGFYCALFQKAWRLFRKNIRIFLVLWCVVVVSRLESALATLLYMKSKYSFHFPQFFIQYQPSGTISRNFLSRIQQKFCILPLHLDVSSFWVGILAFFLLLIMLKPLRSIFRRQSLPSGNPSGVLLKRVFPFAFVCLLISSFFYCYVQYWRLELLPTGVWRILGVITGVFWRVFISSIITGFIILLFLEKNPVTFVSFFKPMFTVKLIIGGFWVLPSLFFVTISRQHLSLAIGIVDWLLLLFVFVPYAVIIEGTDWRGAFRHNFLLWRKKSLHVIVLLILLLVVRLVVVEIPSVLFPLIVVSWQSVIETLFSTGVSSAVSLWTTAVILLFAQEMFREIQNVPKRSQ